MKQSKWHFLFLIIWLWNIDVHASCGPPQCPSQCYKFLFLSQLRFTACEIDSLSNPADSVYDGQLVLAPYPIDEEWVYAIVISKSDYDVTVHCIKSHEAVTMPMEQIRMLKRTWQIAFQPTPSKPMMQHLIQRYLERHPPFEKPQIVVKIVERASRVFGIGDLHGVLSSLKKIFESMAAQGGINDGLQLAENNHSAFLGDFTDRGEEGVETWRFLMHHKLLSNKNATLLRGNHEELAMAQQYNSDQEWLEKIGDGNPHETHHTMNNLFSSLPYALLLGFAHENPAQKPRYRFLYFSHAGIAPTLNLHRPIRAAIAAHKEHNETTPVSLQLPLDISPYQLDMLVWNDFVTNYVVGECPHAYRFPFSRVPGAVLYSHSAGREFIERVQSRADKASYSLDALICGHHHLPCGIAQLNEAVTDGYHWTRLETDQPHLIQTGDVYSCNAFHAYDPMSTAPDSFSCFEPTEYGWQVTPH